MNFICYLESYYDVREYVKVYTCSQIMVFSVLQNSSLLAINRLSLCMKTSFYLLVFLFSLPSVRFLFPIWRFPTQCI